jgi:hypothetical protein
MLDQEFIKWLLTLGVGGAIAALVITFYRKDIKQYTELWRSTAEMLMKALNENTASNVKLISLIESMERNQLRKADIELLVDRRMGNERRDSAN